MTTRYALSLSALLTTMSLATLASAQTADGIGERSTTQQQSAEEAADEIEDLLDLYEYQPRMYQIAVRTWYVKTPTFLLDAFFSRHTDHWTEGVTNLAYGIEFTTRIPDKFDVVTAVDWTNLRTPDGFWLEDGDPVRDADYTTSNLSLLTLDVGLNWFTPLGRREDWNIYYGFGLGLAIRLGSFDKYDIDPPSCGLDTQALRESEDPSLLDNCFAEAEANGAGLPYFVETRSEEDRILPVLPAVSGMLGLRYLIGDNWQVSVEGGLKSIYFFSGLEVGYFWSHRR